MTTTRTVRADCPSVAYDAIFALPVFALGVQTSADEVIAIDFLPAQPAASPRTLLAAEVVRQLQAYLLDPSFRFALPLRPAGTPFQRRVWTHITTIPPGRTESYGEVARAIRSGPRAVGGACGANPYPVVVPCHRVVAASGLGGFGGRRDAAHDQQLAIKRWLLAHEGLTVLSPGEAAAPSA